MRSLLLTILALVAAALAASVSTQDTAGSIVIPTGLDDMKALAARGLNFAPPQKCTLRLYDTSSALVLRLDFLSQLALNDMAVNFIPDPRIRFHYRRFGVSVDGKRVERCLTFTDGINNVGLCVRGPYDSPTIERWYLDSFYTPGTGSDWFKIVKPTFVVDGKPLYREFTSYIKRT
ncbi:uncharacterized protein L969DRAFT_491595 [Mixia osmundae IAM 14324]|uniref:uncharacterized protein n=1 Tax=Mixia osmundae (strain CBS 9802 / IAM 14324 / JCM 22182 / KY 12970) TaxID=764103 RepID=UPI0004A54784|nr:uncharacterized protein L969DRAFT_491595 [Mixia osmundae IAM 14324]KEI38812.1 hypothetical protein L969DRAFT_491595 [Mixia osmundae IAM 14324]